MNELALFAGAGGGILGGALLGWSTVCACEIEKYPRSVLLARQRDGLLPRFPIWDDVTTFDGKPWRGLVDIVTGGFPCQDISCAGKGAGITGARSGLRRARSRGEARHPWQAEPNVGRVADGVASRVDRLKAIGNGQVPLVAATAFLTLTHTLTRYINTL